MINWKATSESEVIINRQAIKKEFLQECFSCQHLFERKEREFKNLILSNADIEKLFYIYDKRFFKGQFSIYLGNNINFSISKRMTSAGGKTIFKKASGVNSFEIRISLVILNNFYLTHSEKKVSGILVHDPIEALLIIMEHEICHVLEFYNYGNSNCKKSRFKSICQEIFAHKSVYHGIPTNKFKNPSGNKLDFIIGDKVNFSYKNNTYKGIIANITKRATVMVLDEKGIYKDKEGKRYTKWYVPLANLFR